LGTSFLDVLEFRHKSWWCDPVYKILREHKITFCGISYPGLPEEVIKTAPVLYYRFHGVPQLYFSAYSNKRLQQIREGLNHFRGTTDVFCYFNNDIEVAAVRNARELQKIASAIPHYTGIPTLKTGLLPRRNLFDLD
jgi:uncharacterized protein YecE (DUF72 family)